MKYLPQTTKAFTLLEVVIALAILGIASGTLINIFSESLNRIRHSERAVYASALAQSLLSRSGDEIAVQSGDKEGEAENGFRWQLHAEPYGDVQDREAWPMQAYKVSSRVYWNDRNEKEEVVLTTIRLLPKGM